MKTILLLIFTVTLAAAQTNAPATNIPPPVSTNAAKRKVPAPVVLPPGYEAVASVQKQIDAKDAELERLLAEYRIISDRNELVTKAGGKSNQSAVRREYHGRTDALKKQKAVLELQMHDLRARYKVPATWPPSAVPAKKTSGGKI